MTLSCVIEALLFSAQKPLSIREMATVIKGAEDEVSRNEFTHVSQAEVAGALEQLKIEYVQEQRAFELIEKAEGWQLATDPKYAQWVRQLFPAPKPARLSAPALETLAIIAYRQPITRADVEAVRGVNIDGVLQTLIERGLVKIAGRAEIPGRPLLYETTQFFLDHFGPCGGHRRCQPAGVIAAGYNRSVAIDLWSMRRTHGKHIRAAPR